MATTVIPESFRQTMTTTIEKLAEEACVPSDVIAESFREILILDSEQKDGHKTMDQGTRELFRRWLSNYMDTKKGGK